MESKDIFETIANSLDNTQKNSTDIETMVRQVRVMSGEESHLQILDGIRLDNTMSWEEKALFIEKENAAYDSREENNTRRVMNMQSMQTKNDGTATNGWARNWGWIATGALALIAICAPTVIRKIHPTAVCAEPIYADLG